MTLVQVTRPTPHPLALSHHGQQGRGLRVDTEGQSGGGAWAQLCSASVHPAACLERSLGSSLEIGISWP